MSDWFHTNVVGIIEDVLLIGGLVTALGIGLKRVYNMARGVEKILEFNKEEKAAREEVAHDLKMHIHDEELKDERRNRELQELISTVREMSREMRPNGGSSMKDVLNHTAEKVGDIHTRVSVLEEWKRNEVRVD